MRVAVGQGAVREGWALGRCLLSSQDGVSAGEPVQHPGGAEPRYGGLGSAEGPGGARGDSGASAGGRGWRQRGALGVSEGLWGPWGSVRGCGSGGERVCESPWERFGLGKGLWGLVEVFGAYGNQCRLMGGLGVVGQLWGLWRCGRVSEEQGFQGFQGFGGAGRLLFLGSVGGLSAGLWG